MNANKTSIGVIIDRSGSMSPLAKDTIGGFNTFLADQKALPGEADLTLVLFDHEYLVVHDGVKLADVPDMDCLTYVPRGNTALRDAIGRTVNVMRANLSAKPDADKPGKVILLIITDGEENSSREYTGDQIRKLLGEVQGEGWDVTYFGANQDAFAVGKELNTTSSVGYIASGAGTRGAYTDMSDRVTRSRTGGI
jgi:hypothetical protein